jgi:hypothetical protein
MILSHIPITRFTRRSRSSKLGRFKYPSNTAFARSILRLSVISGPLQTLLTTYYEESLRTCGRSWVPATDKRCPRSIQNSPVPPAPNDNIPSPSVPAGDPPDSVPGLLPAAGGIDALARKPDPTSASHSQQKDQRRWPPGTNKCLCTQCKVCSSALVR